MGSGNWDKDDFVSYSCSTGKTVNFATGDVTSNRVQDFYKQKDMHPTLDPYNVIRECCDGEDHPATIPVILALDVTGSMGSACVRTAQKLNEIMTTLYNEIPDVEFMVMGIGDLAYDSCPIQASQFESDVRIAEAMDRVYMEHGGGGNGYESYTAAWYFGLHNTKLDCWGRGKKGIIITMGDEPLNPYLPRLELNEVLGSKAQANVETKDLYKEVLDKFDVYHLAINDYDSSYGWYRKYIENTWGELLGDNYKAVTLDELPQAIVACITNSRDSEMPIDNSWLETPVETKEEKVDNVISW